MTAENEKKLIKAHSLIKEVFPDMCGDFRFHLHPEQKKIIYYVQYSGMIKPRQYSIPN